MSSVDDHINLKSDYDYRVSEKQDLSKFINELVNSLPEKNAAVLNLYYINEISCEEISKLMNTSLSNVKVMLHRSRSALKDYILKNNLVKELL